MTLRAVPGERSIRARELQVHGIAVPTAEPGRVAINVAGIGVGELQRGLVLTNDPATVSSDRLLARLGLCALLVADLKTTERHLHAL